jgi:cytochrome c-type biogenesis protein
MEHGFLTLAVLPVGLGLLGFIEPCSMGSTLVFIKFLEGRSAAAKIAHVAVFTATRAVFIGLLGALAVVAGTAIVGFQKGAWIFLGAIYVAMGVFYLADKAGVLMRSLGPGLGRIIGFRGSAGLGILFGLNIPGFAAAAGAAGPALAAGFVSLALFGLALSLPIAIAVLFAPARRALDWLAGLSERLPFWTGVVLIGLGLWSIGFGLLVEVKA